MENAKNVLTPFEDKKSERWGYVDGYGKTIIFPQFANAGNFSEGLAPAQKIKLLGRIAGKFFVIIISAISKFYGEGEQGLQNIFGGKYGYIDMVGKFVIKPQYNWAGNFSEGLARARIGDKWNRWGKYGYIGKFGNFIIAPVFDDAEDFHNGFAYIEWQPATKPVGFSYKGQIYKTGEIKVNTESFPSFMTERFSEGLAYIDINYKFGYINKAGDFVIEPQFDDADKFSEGLARINIGGKWTSYSSFCQGGYWGFIDKSGDIIIQPQYHTAESFINGIAKVGVSGKYFYINKKGEVIKE